MKRSETVDYQIKATWHSIFKMYNQIATKHDTTQATGFVLLSIAKEGTPSTAIAPLLGMEATSLSRILRNLEDKALIYRKTDKSDKRKVIILLTENGIEKRKIAKKVVSGFNKLIVEEIPEEKLATFFDVMETINKTVEKYKQENV